MAIAAAVVGAGVAVGASVYGAVKTNQAINDAKNQQAKDKADQQKAQDELAQKQADLKKQQEAQVTAQTENIAGTMANTQAARRGKGVQYGNSLLTSPLGGVGNSGNSAAPKTLLGL